MPDDHRNKHKSTEKILVGLPLPEQSRYLSMPLDWHWAHCSGRERLETLLRRKEGPESKEMPVCSQLKLEVLFKKLVLDHENKFTSDMRPIHKTVHLQYFLVYMFYFDIHFEYLIWLLRLQRVCFGVMDYSWMLKELGRIKPQ